MTMRTASRSAFSQSNTGFIPKRIRLIGDGRVRYTDGAAWLDGSDSTSRCNAKSKLERGIRVTVTLITQWLCHLES